MNKIIIRTVMLASSSTDFSAAATPIISLVNSLTGPMLGIVLALGSLYCIFLGAKLAKAEEPQDREKAKAALKNAVIGFVLIFVLIVALHQLVPLLTAWTNSNSGNYKIDDSTFK